MTFFRAMSPRKRYLLFLALIAIAVLAVDQITKQVILNSISQSESVGVCGDFLRLTLVHNQGGVFSTNLGSTLFYTVSSIIIVVALLLFVYKDAGKNRLVDLALALIVGGALGNLVDRIRFGSVVDFIDVEFFDIHIPAGKLIFWQHSGYELTRWPVFNLADAAVTIGIVLIILQMLLPHRRTRHAAEESDS